MFHLASLISRRAPLAPQWPAVGIDAIEIFAPRSVPPRLSVTRIAARSDERDPLTQKNREIRTSFDTVEARIMTLYPEIQTECPNRHPSLEWKKVKVLGFSAGETPFEAGVHAAALGMTQMCNCESRNHNSAEDYVDCRFTDEDNESIRVSFFRDRLCLIQYTFNEWKYAEVVANISASLGTPQISSREARSWGGPELGFIVDARRWLTREHGVLRVEFNMYVT